MEKLNRVSNECAPSIAFGLGSDTRFTLSYLHQHDENTPQYGVPYFMNVRNDGPIPGVDTSNYYGYRNVDTQEIDVETADQRAAEIDLENEAGTPGKVDHHP